jgi:murein DD-endopeptidase MepM/ murein hydrolase activator NlpD
MASGIDIGTLTSLDVTAAAAGVVAAVGYVPGYDGHGAIVVVDIGCTGWCTGTHLNFELRSGGTAIDPAPLLP